MDASKTFLELVSLLNSWFPWQSEPENVSRDFWMPDHICRVCYDCDSQFTLFNRRHHCRLCGRVFCAKCTANSIPSHSDDSKIPQEERERLRVCNYCFKQREQQRIITTIDDGVQGPDEDVSTSPSATSYISTKSSYTTSSFTLGSVVLSPRQRPSISRSMDAEDPSSKYEDLSNRFRSGDDEDECNLSDSETKHFAEDNGFSCPIEDFDDMGNDESHTFHPDSENIDSKCLSCSTVNQSFPSPQLVKKDEPGVSDECETSLSVYATEPVDFENNRLLWLPPEPQNEEDDKEALLFDDDDDVDPTGDWGYMRSSSSFGSGESRIRDGSREEHKKAVKNMVDGHFRALVAQLLQVECLPVGYENDKNSWLEIITALSWEVATLLKPDTSKGGGMDPGGYVKVKCIASGRPCESMVVKGVVCKKNVAHRRMASKIEKPRLLILGGALEYQRVSNLLSCFDTLLQQERDHLKMAVAKIHAHQPNVLLVEKTVSRFAQEYLLEKDISLVLNIRRPLLERIARCTGAQIIPSIDHLSSQKLGYCEQFHVERFMEDLGSAGQGGKKLGKTLMYFEGCRKPSGFTILLRGANGDELKKVKHVIQYGIFAAYHLSLETSFLADEGASLPDSSFNSPLTVSLLDTPPTIARSISTFPGFTVLANETSHEPPHGSEPERANSIPTLSLSSLISSHNFPNQETAQSCLSKKTETGPKESLMMESFVDKSESAAISNHLTSSQKHNNHSEQPKQLKEVFAPTPSDNQSILVSLSSRCVRKGTVCERSHLFRIKYYGSFDKPLGRFLRDHLFDQNYRCESCEMPSEAHVHCYTHRQGTLTISVKKLTDIVLPGERVGKIWMWHRCLQCPRMNGFPPATLRVLMSDAAWGLSFGKFLELSFSNHAAASRVASCGHSLHRDCLRFYGFGRMVACFRYASVDVHSVYLPTAKVDFDNETQEWTQKEKDKVIDRADHLFSEVLNSLSQIAEKKFGKGAPNGIVKTPELRHQIAELEGILHKEKLEFEESLEQALNRELRKGQPVIDILEINRLRRQLLFQSYMWDHRLVFAMSLENNVTDGEVLKDSDVLEHGKDSECCDSALVDTKLDRGSDRREFNRNTDQSDVIEAADLGIEDYGNVSASLSMFDRLDCEKPTTTVRRVLSEGQFAVIKNLSDTLDAAWTGEIQRVIVLPKKDSCTFSYSTAGVATEGLDLENHSEEKIVPKVLHPHSPALSAKGSENLEDSIRWLKMPFLSFYRSLNKNFLGSASKLDTFSKYDPVYVSSFRELEMQDGARLLLPLGVNDIVIPVYDDEPTSIISYALASPEYRFQTSNDMDRHQENGDDSMNFQSCLSVDESTFDRHQSFDSTDESTLHARVSFGDDKVIYTVTCYYAERFDALRRMCCSLELDYIRSLSRCKKWGAQGGKSNVFFAKTLDDRFIVKQVTKTELESFIKFAPGYFNYLSESISSRSPTCLAKILGIYQITAKHLKGGKETKMDVLVMENLLFRRSFTRLYDLKGSLRSRYNPDSSGSNKVLLDQNFVESMPTSPLFVGNKAKRLLERAVWNDTAFLTSSDVMDYSLLVGVDEEKHELVVGIIDFMRQYTWDKHLETWVKASGILGGSRNASPTVISPEQYKKRFRKAMSTYFLVIPDHWSPPPSDTGEEKWTKPDLD